VNLEFKKPKIADIKAMQELVKKEVEAGIILNRTPNEMATNIRSYIIALVDNKIVGFLALHIHTVELAEIRSMIVGENFRGLGIGSKLIELAVKEAQNLGLKDILVLTYSKSLFEKSGFVEIPKETIPETKIWADCIKCKHFPICNEVSLIKKI